MLPKQGLSNTMRSIVYLYCKLLLVEHSLVAICATTTVTMTLFFCNIDILNKVMNELCVFLQSLIH